MSYRVLSYVREHSGQRDGALLVLLTLADFADSEGKNAYPTLATIARRTTLAPQVVRRILAALVGEGAIAIAPPPSTGLPRRYTIFLPDDFTPGAAS